MDGEALDRCWEDIDADVLGDQSIKYLDALVGGDDARGMAAEDLRESIVRSGVEKNGNLMSIWLGDVKGLSSCSREVCLHAYLESRGINCR